MTAPTPAAHTAGRWSRAAVDAWGVVVRCEVILAGVAAVLAVVVSAAQQSDLGESISFLSWVWAVHGVITLVLGYPLGVVVTRLLPPRPARGRGAGAYAVAGGVAAALVILLWGVAPPAGVAGWGALGAATAGTARLWADGAIRARAERREALAARPVPAVPAPALEATAPTSAVQASAPPAPESAPPEAAVPESAVPESTPPAPAALASAPPAPAPPASTSSEAPSWTPPPPPR
ncbi:hypothetical protein [Cellulomonas pakistanensis]|uniref:Uncharacterized protein n=1 Tax=Cellulomonas pakistanensis TaxID=992287 RepID=A0A919P888_9CELL|nr:hypothetical protein [Cellulomonas pakistanensis]GIG34805.1 hypothetical protein Cpa01nite_01860 [Cellulomonas pakistanensis]